VSDALSQPIETERLSLRPVRPADAEDLFAIMRDPAIGAAMHEPPPESEATVRARIEAWIRGPGSDVDERWLNWIARTYGGHPVAHLAATIHGEVAWLAWVVGVDSQRHGYATEAARAVTDRLATDGIGTFAASIRNGHEASEGVARHLGMRVTDEVVTGERVWRTRERSPG